MSEARHHHLKNWQTEYRRTTTSLSKRWGLTVACSRATSPSITSRLRTQFSGTPSNFSVKIYRQPSAHHCSEIQLCEPIDCRRTTRGERQLLPQSLADFRLITCLKRNYGAGENARAYHPVDSASHKESKLGYDLPDDCR